MKITNYYDITRFYAVGQTELNRKEGKITMKRLVTVLIALIGITLMAEEIDYEKYYKPYRVRDAEIQKVLEAFNKTENPDDNCEATQLFNRILKITTPQRGKRGMLRTGLYATLTGVYLPQQKIGSAKRRYIVKLIMDGLTNDNDSYNKSHIIEWLIPVMQPEDLDEHARAIFSKMLKERNAYDASIFLFAKVGMDKELSETPIDYKTFSSGKFIHSMDWGLLLFKARQGDKDSIKKTLALIEDCKDPIIKVIILSLSLAFVPQPEIVEYLKKQLNSDERLPSDVDPEPGTLYGCYSAKALNILLKDFPDRNSGDDYIKECRKWMNKQKEWHFNPNPIPYYPDIAI